MNDFVRNVIRTGLIFFAAAALVSLAAPYIGVAVGLAPTVEAAATAIGHTANPLWLGAYLGGFGALQATVAPIVNAFFEKNKAAKAAPAPEPKKGGSLTIELSPEQEKEISGALSHFRERVKTGQVEIGR